MTTPWLDDLTFIDEIARLSVRADEGDLVAERELLNRYRGDDRLHPGSTVMSASPNGGFFQIDLAARTTTRLG